MITLREIADQVSEEDDQIHLFLIKISISLILNESILCEQINLVFPLVQNYFGG